MRQKILCQLFALSLFAQSQPPRLVSSGKGWLIDGHLTTRGTVLPETSVVSGTVNDGELIVECPKGWIQYMCGDKCRFPPCFDKTDTKPAVGKITVKELGMGSRFLNALVVREPKDVVTLGVRAGGNPSDALLLEDARGVHWGPALNRVLEGHYCLRLIPLPSGPVRTFSLDWDRSSDSEGVGAAPNLTGGVYSLQKGTPGSGSACTVDPDSVPAWVTILSQDQYANAIAVWKTESARITQIERSRAGPDAAAILRHAVLASLADSTASQRK
jgi:hypothetical protein